MPQLMQGCLLTGDASASIAAAALNTWLWQSPTFAAAASRLITQHRAAMNAAQAQARFRGAAAAPASAATLKQVQASMHNVLRVALRPLLSAQHKPLGSPVLADNPPCAATVCRAVPALLTAPGLIAALPPELRRQLSASSGLDQCCRWLQLLLSPAQPPAVESRRDSRGSTATQRGVASIGEQPAVTAADAANGMLNLAMLTLPEASSMVRTHGLIRPHSDYPTALFHRRCTCCLAHHPMRQQSDGQSVGGRRVPGDVRV